MSDDATTVEVPAQEQQPEPAPAPAAAEDKKQTFDAEYVAKLRAEAAKYRTDAKANAEAAKRLAEIEEANKTEAQKQAEALQRLQQENEALKLQSLTAQVAAEKGVPAELLTGSTREEIEARADALLTFRGEQKQTPPDFGAGQRGTETGIKQLSRADLAQMTPQQINDARLAGQLDDVLAGR